MDKTSGNMWLLMAMLGLANARQAKEYGTTIYGWLGCFRTKHSHPVEYLSPFLDQIQNPRFQQVGQDVGVGIKTMFVSRCASVNPYYHRRLWMDR